jgi:hypothetical protein
MHTFGLSVLEGPQGQQAVAHRPQPCFGDRQTDACISQEPAFDQSISSRTADDSELHECIFSAIMLLP